MIVHYYPKPAWILCKKRLAHRTTHRYSFNKDVGFEELISFAKGTPGSSDHPQRSSGKLVPQAEGAGWDRRGGWGSWSPEWTAVGGLVTFSSRFPPSCWVLPMRTTKSMWKRWLPSQNAKSQLLFYKAFNIKVLFVFSSHAKASLFSLGWNSWCFCPGLPSMLSSH